MGWWVLVDHYITQLLDIKWKQQEEHQIVERNLKKLHQGSTGEGWQGAELRRDVDATALGHLPRNYRDDARFRCRYHGYGVSSVSTREFWKYV